MLCGVKQDLKQKEKEKGEEVAAVGRDSVKLTCEPPEPQPTRKGGFRKGRGDG